MAARTGSQLLRGIVFGSRGLCREARRGLSLVRST